MLLATRTAYADLSYLSVGARAPFRIVGTLPAGYHHAAYTISATPTTRLIGAPTPTTTTNGLNGSGKWVVAGTSRTRTRRRSRRCGSRSRSMTGAAASWTPHGRAWAPKTLGALQSTTFSATFIPLGLAPNKTYIRGMVFR